MRTGYIDNPAAQDASTSRTHPSIPQFKLRSISQLFKSKWVPRFRSKWILQLKSKPEERKR